MYRTDQMRRRNICNRGRIFSCARFKFTAKFLNHALHGPRGRITKRTDRIAFDIIGNIQQKVDIFRSYRLPPKIVLRFFPSTRILHGTVYTARTIHDDKNA